MRKLIKDADPDVVEEWKWVKATKPGTPVWSHDGILCTGETYKNVVKLTFAKGASLKDPARLFNSSLDGHVRRGDPSTEVVVGHVGGQHASIAQPSHWVFSPMSAVTTFLSWIMLRTKGVPLNVTICTLFFLPEAITPGAANCAILS
jgi:hypothetical protein